MLQVPHPSITPAGIEEVRDDDGKAGSTFGAAVVHQRRRDRGSAGSFSALQRGKDPEQLRAAAGRGQSFVDAIPEQREADRVARLQRDVGQNRGDSRGTGQLVRHADAHRRARIHEQVEVEMCGGARVPRHQLTETSVIVHSMARGSSPG